MSEPRTLLEGVPAGNDHNGGRLAIGPDGMLYYSLGEQGANQFANFCNPIEAQRLPTQEEIAQADWSAYKGNYGWPHIAGYRDNQAYAYVNWSEAENCDELTWTNLTDAESIPAGVPRHEETDWAEPFVEPLKTLYTVHNGYDLEDEACGELFFICRPSVAPSSVDYYPDGGSIPGWSAGESRLDLGVPVCARRSERVIARQPRTSLVLVISTQVQPVSL